METATILSHVDHTLLKPEATWDQIKTLCDEAMEFGCATVCIPPSYVKRAAEYVQGNLKICTVIGFPNGYNTMAAKIFETKDAVENGASEIDMVINLGWVKDRNWKDLAQEIAGVKAACLGRPLKVIIETCLLSDMEKIKLCQLVAKEGADYLKTSTGFSTGGATREDVALLRENLPKQVKLKASGGIRTLADGEAYLALGADRLGASALVGEARKQFRLPIPLPRNPLRELNAYLIRGRERSLLIDTGFREPACRQALQAGLRAAGAEHDPLDVLLTHIHTDHTGLASEVVRPGGAIYIGRGDYPFTSRAWEEEYWGRIDQRFLQEGFPPEELRITTGTNPITSPWRTGTGSPWGNIPWRSSLPPAIPRVRSACGWQTSRSSSPRTMFSLTSPPTSPCGPICPTPWAATWRA